MGIGVLMLMSYAAGVTANVTEATAWNVYVKCITDETTIAVQLKTLTKCHNKAVVTLRKGL